MSILDPIELNLEKADKAMGLMQERELLFFDLLDTAAVKRVVTKYNLPQLITEAIDQSHFEYLSRHKGRGLVSLDCKGLKKGDAYRWMVNLSKKVEEIPDLIVIIENITEIPDDPQCDDPQYVENLLGHSWKNRVVFFNGNRIDTSNLTIILTTIPDRKDFLGLRYRTDSYALIDDFDDMMSAVENQIRNS